MNLFLNFRTLHSVLWQEAADGGGLSPLNTLLLVVLLIIIIWLLLRTQTSQVEQPEHDHHDDHAAMPEPAPEPEPAPSAGPDNLKVIEGIGPKVEVALNGAGISTYHQLAAAAVDQIQAVLDNAGYQYMNPASWPDQARLAAAGDWDALKKLQDELTGGR